MSRLNCCGSLRRKLLRPAFAQRWYSATAFLSDRTLDGLPMDISDEVQDGLNRHLPMLALESAIITHGLPYPTSLSLPKELEGIARASGTIPAHIAIVKGRIKVGLNDSDLAILADPEQNPKQRWKVGRRELAGAISQGVNGGLTVSATMKIAHMAGIKIFATGGIGGVHRGAQITMDISSDLTELARTPVAVVCAGAKSILDIGLTLEYLETLGVPVVTVGKSTEFPAFYTAHSGYHASMTCDSVRACAEMIRTSELLKSGSGIVFGVPIPKEHSKDGEIIQDAVQQAVKESEDLKINQKGKEVTPWLLQRVNQLTTGRSVIANLALIRNNVAVAAQISKEYQNIRSTDQAETFGHHSVLSVSPAPHQLLNSYPKPPKDRLMIIGAAAVDITSTPLQSHQSKDTPSMGTTEPGVIKLSAGGVALNLARTAYSLGVDDVAMITVIGGKNAPLTQMLKSEIAKTGLRTDGLHELADESKRTAVVNMLMDHEGNLKNGVADMEIMDELKGKQLFKIISERDPNVVCMDGNISTDGIEAVIRVCQKTEKIVVFEPTSIPKSMKIIPALQKIALSTDISQKPPLSVILPNYAELKAIYNVIIDQEADNDSLSSQSFQIMDSFGLDERFRTEVKRKLPSWVTDLGVMQMAITLLPLIKVIVIKKDKDGAVLIGRLRLGDGQVQKDNTPGWVRSSGGVMIKHFPAPIIDRAEEGSFNVTGAGDTLAGAILTGLVNGFCLDEVNGWDELLTIAQRAALKTLRSNDAVGCLLDIKRSIQQPGSNTSS